jgi:hypothetical protein
MKWVKSKKDVQAINVLLNLFMDEMMGRFWRRWWLYSI